MNQNRLFDNLRADVLMTVKRITAHGIDAADAPTRRPCLYKTCISFTKKSPARKIDPGFQRDLYPQLLLFYVVPVFFVYNPDGFCPLF